MIHSMSGGVLSELDSYTFVKVKFEENGAPYWYITDFDVEDGDRVLAPFGVYGAGREATVIRVDRNVSGMTPPVPLKRVKKLLKKL